MIGGVNSCNSQLVFFFYRLPKARNALDILEIERVFLSCVSLSFFFFFFKLYTIHTTRK